MDAVVSRILAAMKQNGLDQKTFAAKIGVRPQAITEWKKGVTTSYTKYIPQIVSTLGVSAEFLFPEAKENPAAILSVPVLGDVAAGIPIEAIQDIVDYEELDKAMTGTGDYFGLRLKGDSMEPRMRDGDVVIVRKQSDAENGDIVVAMVNGDNATVKRIKKGLSGITLIPNNPAYDPMFYTNEEIAQLPVRILGKVVELRAKF